MFTSLILFLSCAKLTSFRNYMITQPGFAMRQFCQVSLRRLMQSESSGERSEVTAPTGLTHVTRHHIRSHGLVTHQQSTWYLTFAKLQTFSIRSLNYGDTNLVNTWHIYIISILRQQGLLSAQTTFSQICGSQHLLRTRNSQSTERGTLSAKFLSFHI